MLFFDDQFPIHRKVAGLSDAAFRLHVSAIFWCRRNSTDGVVPAEDLDDVSARVRKPSRFASECVSRGLWHEIGAGCASEACPARNAVTNGVTDGWVIHDYFDWQKSKERVQQDRKANAERQRKWRDQHKQAAGAAVEARNAVTNASVTAPSPVQSPSQRDGTSLGDQSAGGQSVRAGARVREGRRWLHDQHRLTDDEADLVLADADRRSPTEIRSYVKYLASWDPAELVDVIYLAQERVRGRKPDRPPLAAVPDPVPEQPARTEPPSSLLDDLRRSKGWRSAQ